MKNLLLTLLFISSAFTLSARNNENHEIRTITVSGSSSVSITPDMATIDISLEEYYRKTSPTDSVPIKLPEIEKQVRKILADAGVADSLILVSDISNYYNYRNPNEFTLGKTLSVTLTQLLQLDEISNNLPAQGIRNFRISKLDNSNMEKYNRQGLQAALRKANEKAQFIADSEGLKLVGPITINEEGPVYYDEEAAMATNVTLDGGAPMLKMASGMQSLRKIIRRYSVNATFQFELK